LERLALVLLDIWIYTRARADFEEEPMTVIFELIFVGIFLVLGLLLVFNTENVLKLLGIVLLPLFLVRNAYDWICGHQSGLPPARFQKILRDEDFPKVLKHSIDSTPSMNFGERMYKRRMQMEAEQNKRRTSRESGISGMEANVTSIPNSGRNTPLRRTPSVQ